jgi:mono/diheme cytochrome c family protein
VARWIRWTGRALAGVVLLVAFAVGTIYFVTTRHMRETYELPISPVGAAADSASLERGPHLVEAIGKCQECHGADRGGEMWVDAPAFGRLAGSNLTPGRGGIGDLTDADLERALRHGVGGDRRPLIFMPSEAFAALGDRDLAAMLGYLRTLPPVHRELPEPTVGPVGRTLYLVGNLPLLPVRLIDHGAPHPDRIPSMTAEYGEYLATIGGCRGCHGLALAGDANPDAPDLTVGRLGGWTEQDFFASLRRGKRPDGSVIDPERMPWVRSGLMTDDEIRAVWMYVRSLPAAEPE